ncbi:ATPase, P-type (transporting), HAD superfamily, subfamily IC [Bifidobacterium bohemicum]|uniref:Lead, cadmium, zinc and mercury transporting ATPase n=2 Tax=Bifidobacterium bohemicum TaxID=638617 RepID=A0A086ZHG6_9BIFI|nr:Lead, cadmium, zinc and mercury transporting ATPase [Bifidobacterium bohemicum DSM 22767]SCC13905.1 ATPase, P-type (transporting), HAD superfamily, subfamily IC [Bifidobacterium bohemicum]
MIKRILRKTAEICRQVPMLPVTIVAAVFVALLWRVRLWAGSPSWFISPSAGQLIVVALVLVSVVDAVRGMVESIRQGHVGVDVLAILALLSTLAVGAYWASWAVVLMIWSGEAIESFAQGKAAGNLNALVDAAPRMAHISTVPGISRDLRAQEARQGAAQEDRQRADGFRATGSAPVGVVHAGSESGRATRPESGSAAHPVSGSDPTSASQAASATAARAASHFRTIPAEEVALDDVLVVLPGETVPVDGTLLGGSATLDLSAINGEPLPRTVFAGARIMSGAVNGSGALVMRATQLAKDSQYQKTMGLVAAAQTSRAPVVRTADVLAVPFTVVSLAIAIVAWIASGTPMRFAQVLVLATPCPLLIAAPVAYVAGTARLAKSGVFIKTQAVLESLGRVRHIFFDKTGTLTVSRPQVARVEVRDDMRDTLMGKIRAAADLEGYAAVARRPDSGFTSQMLEDYVIAMAAIVETYSVHILGHGIVEAGRAVARRLSEEFGPGAGVSNGVVRPRTASVSAAKSTQPHQRSKDFPFGTHPVVRGVHEQVGQGVEGMVDGSLIRVGRFDYVSAPLGQSQSQEQPGAAGSLGSQASFGASGVSDASKVSNVSDTSTGSSGGARNSTVFSGAPRPSDSSNRSGISGESDVPTRTSASGQPVHSGPASSPAASSGDGLFPVSRFGERAADEMVTYVSVDGEIVARIVLRDVPRHNAKESLQRLKALGVRQITMLTGDGRASAEVIAAEVGIADVRADMLPQDKLAAVEAVASEPQEKASGVTAKVAALLRTISGQPTPRPVSMMVGDGVNDAPVLAAADIGVAVTDGTSTAAAQSAELVIMNDDIGDVPQAIVIARETKRVLLQSVIAGLGLAIVCMVLAAFNLIPVVVGAFMQEGIDVVSILWALTALRDRKG